MGLKYWFPLNNSLKDRGPYNKTLSITGTTAYGNGIIGQNLTLNGSTWGQVSGVTIGTNATIACWARINNSESMFWGIQCSASDYMNIYNSSTICLNIGDGTSNPFKDSNGNTIATIADNVWHHWTVVFEGSNNAKLYIDGIYRGQAISYRNPTMNNKIFTLGTWNYSSHGYNINGAMADVRIYDHALTASEIYKLSKGLALHYTLDGSGGVRPNMVASSNIAQNVTGSTYYFGGNNLGTGTLKNNTKYTFTVCAWVEKKGSGAKYFTLYLYDTGWVYKCPSWNITDNVPTIKKFTFTTGSAAENYEYRTGLYNMPSTGDGSNIIHFLWYKLEEGDGTPYVPKYSDTAYASTPYNLEADIDGLGYNGIKTGNLTLSSLAGGRYPRSTVFNSNEAIQLGNLASIVPQGNFTFNIWFYKDRWSSKGYDTIFGGPGGFELELKPGGNNTPLIRPYSWGGSDGSQDIAYTMNVWHMLTMVRTSSAAKFYLDGALQKTCSAGSIPSGNYFIGSWHCATEQNYAGLASDARIYATAFTDDDVMKLYRGEI